MTKFQFDEIDAGAAVFDETADCLFEDPRDRAIVVNKRTGEPILVQFAGPTHPVTRKLDGEAFRRIKAQVEALRGRKGRSKQDDEELAEFEAKLREGLVARALGWTGIDTPFSAEACMAFFAAFPVFEGQARDFLGGDASFLPVKKTDTSRGAGTSSSTEDPPA